MNSPQEPPPQEPQKPSISTPLEASEQDFDQALATLEESLQALKERYSQVQQDQQRQATLQERHDRLEQELRSGRTPELTAELQQIQAQLDELEVNLESRLLSWASFREPFWQVIRFGGAGILLGWFLALASVNQPEPQPQPAPPGQPVP